MAEMGGCLEPSKEELTTNLVDSLIEVGLVLPDDGPDLIDEVLEGLCGAFSCGNNGKVLVCHIPADDPGDAQTLCISPKAVPAHLANHGDSCGSCDVAP